MDGVQPSQRASGRRGIALWSAYLFGILLLSTLGACDGENDGQSIAVDSAGNIYYIYETEIKKISSAGVDAAFAGGSQSGWIDGAGRAPRLDPGCG